MYKQVLILLAVVGAVACEVSSSSDGAAANAPSLADIPAGVVQTPLNSQPLVIYEGTSFGDHLKEIYKATKDHAQKAYNDAKPAIEGLHEDIKQTVHNIKNNPRIAKSIDAANNTRDKLRPIYDKTGKRVQGLLTKVQEHRQKRRDQKQAPSPLGNGQVLEQVDGGAAQEATASLNEAI